MTPSPILLGKLARAKLLTRWQAASVGVGERRSRAKGAGIEFADHREYQPGDDIKHLDPHLYARFGRHYIRQYDVYRQLPITILVDASRSMNCGNPNKFAFACGIASSLGFVGLAGGDGVQIGVCAGEMVNWSPRFHGVARSQRMFDWIGAQQSMNSGEFGSSLLTATRRFTDPGLVIVLSDWWTNDPENHIRILSATGQEIWGIQIASQEELDPDLLGEGEARLFDIENGHEIELALDRSTRERYVREFEVWREQLQGLFTRVNGRYVLVPSNQSMDRLLLQDWRHLGLIG